MQTTTLMSMFLLGLLGTGHCVGMCGPLVLALPGRQKSVWPHLLYHLGRANTYVMFGALLGGLGQVLRVGGESTLGIALWVQRGMTAASCLFLIWFGCSKIGILKSPEWLVHANPGLIPGFSFFQKELLKTGGFFSYYLLGLLFGFLPCGLSYAAFAAALSSAQFVTGGVMVFVFALGTIPGLLLVGMTASKLFNKYQDVSNLIAGLLMIGIAIHQGLRVIEGLG